MNEIEHGSDPMQPS